jgi:histidine phosphotransferase ChpT
MTLPLPKPSLDIQLAEMVATRLCHDFCSPLSTLTALMPQAGEAAARDLLVETVAELKARHRLFCAVFGMADGCEWSHLATLLEGAPTSHRVRFVLGAAPGQAPPSPSTVRLLLSALMLAAEALPRGGAVRLACDAEGGFSIMPEGRDAAWSPPLVELVSGGSLEAALAHGPRRSLAAWTLRLALAERRWLDFALGRDGTVPPLVISSPR